MVELDKLVRGKTAKEKSVERQYVTPEVAAKILRYTPGTVRILAEVGELPMYIDLDTVLAMAQAKDRLTNGGLDDIDESEEDEIDEEDAMEGDSTTAHPARKWKSDSDETGGSVAIVVEQGASSNKQPTDSQLRKFAEDQIGRDVLADLTNADPARHRRRIRQGRPLYLHKVEEATALIGDKLTPQQRCELRARLKKLGIL